MKVGILGGEACHRWTGSAIFDETIALARDKGKCKVPPARSPVRDDKREKRSRVAPLLACLGLEVVAEGELHDAGFGDR